MVIILQILNENTFEEDSLRAADKDIQNSDIVKENQTVNAGTLNHVNTDEPDTGKCLNGKL